MIRRTFLGGLLSTPFGDWSGPRGTGANQPRPMNAPPARELSIGVQPGIPNVIRARIVIVSGPNGGVFVYDPTPGLGNLIASVTDATTDPFGNPTQKGVTSYNPGVAFSELLSGDLIFGSLAPATLITTNGAFVLGDAQNALTSPLIQLSSPISGAASRSGIALRGGSSDGTTHPAQIVMSGPLGGGGVPHTSALLEVTGGAAFGQSGQGYTQYLVASGDTTGATDSAAISNAYLQGGTTDVVLLPGQWWVSNVQVPANCQLRGCGPGTQLNLPNSTGTLVNMITNATNAQLCRISDMLLDGNNTNQGAGAWQAGIVLNNPPADGRHVVRNVRIQNFTGDGLVQLNRGSSQFSDIQIFGCNGFGVNAHEDCYYTNIDVGASGLDGFLIQGGSNRFASCKSFFSGAALVSGRGAGATLLTVTPPAQAFDGGSLTGGFTFSLASGFGSGFHYANIGGSGTAPALNASAGEIAACCAQDNARNGFLLQSRRMALTAIDADSNNNNGTTGGVPNGNYAGVEITGNRNNVQGVSWNRAANVNAQAAALEIVSSLGTATLNRVDLGFDGSLNDGSNMPPLTAASTLYDNGVTFRTMGGRSYENHAFGASVTPDPFATELFQMTLTANTTINAPALAGTNTTGLFLVPGMRLTILLIQDGVGGHTVTFDPAFAGMSAVNLGAGKTTVWTTIFFGSWAQTGFNSF